MILCSLLVGSMNSTANETNAQTCPVTHAKLLKETTLKLALLSKGYRIIEMTFDDPSNCWRVYGYNSNKVKVSAIIDPYSGRLIHEENAKNDKGSNPAPS